MDVSWATMDKIKIRHQLTNGEVQNQPNNNQPEQSLYKRKESAPTPT